MAKCLIFLLFIFLIALSCSAQICKTHHPFSTANRYISCNDLPVLDSFFHWSFYRENNTINIAYRHAKIDTSRWVACAINPTSKGMIGSQALIAYTNSNGSVRAYTSSITSYGTRLEESPLSFEVFNFSAKYTDNEAHIYATIVLPQNLTTINLVWQDGPVNGDRLGMHKFSGDAVKAMTSVDLLSGEVITTKTISSRTRKNIKNIHGIINTATWGTLMPIGAMIARYLKYFKSADPLWFYLHLGCQLLAYVGGIGGAITGFYLGNKSRGIEFDTHKNIGVVLLCLGFLQILALPLRPKKNGKYRPYWNFYHHSMGYVVIILSVINVYQGMKILAPRRVYKLTYTTMISCLALLALALEITTYFTKGTNTLATEEDGGPTEEV